MYYIPGYVTEELIDNKTLNIKSALYKNEIALVDSKIIEEYLYIKKNGSQKIDSQLSTLLHNEEMLCNQFELLNICDLLRNRMKNKMILTIMPTERCNFRCIYCYEHHNKIDMNDITVNAIIELVKNNIDSLKSININWFGGEPTLRLDIVKKISREVMNMSKKNGIEYIGSMTTNGFLLKSKIVKELVTLGIKNYQITIDGFDNDKTRPFVGNESSLKTILNNLREIKGIEKNVDFKIILRRNILPYDTFDWYDFLKKEFGEDKRFSYLIRTVENFGGNKIKSIEIIERSIKDSIIKKHTDYLKENEMICENDNIDNVMEPYGKMCYAAFPLGFVFRASGIIEKCTVNLGNENNIVGYIADNGELCINKEKNKKWTEIQIGSNCLKCSNIISCNNLQCPAKKIFGNKLYMCGKD